MSPPSIPRLNRYQKTLVKRDEMNISGNLSFECVVHKETEESMKSSKLTKEELTSDLQNKLAATISLNNALSDEIRDLRDQIKAQGTEITMLMAWLVPL